MNGEATYEATYAQLSAAAEEVARIVAGTTPEQFGSPTPCGKWDVKELLNHLILWTAYSFERRARSEQVGEELTARDFASEPGYAAAYRVQLDRALEAWAPDEVWASEIDTGNAKMPASEVAGMILMEMVLHGWDLAVATGQGFSVPDDVAETVCAAATGAAELYRQYGGFADEVEAGDGASPLERALAVSGRRPAR